MALQITPWMFNALCDLFASVQDTAAYGLIPLENTNTSNNNCIVAMDAGFSFTPTQLRHSPTQNSDDAAAAKEFTWHLRAPAVQIHHVTNDREDVMWLSDKTMMLPAVLMRSCVDELKEVRAHASVHKLIGGTIELTDFEIAVSTPERPGPRPIFLIVRQVLFTGGDECHTFGNPTDANNATCVSHALARHPPEELTWHFQRSQAISDQAPPRPQFRAETVQGQITGASGAGSCTFVGDQCVGALQDLRSKYLQPCVNNELLPRQLNTNLSNLTDVDSHESDAQQSPDAGRNATVRATLAVSDIPSGASIAVAGAPTPLNGASAVWPSASATIVSTTLSLRAKAAMAVRASTSASDTAATATATRAGILEGTEVASSALVAKAVGTTVLINLSSEISAEALSAERAIATATVNERAEATATERTITTTTERAIATAPTSDRVIAITATLVASTKSASATGTCSSTPARVERSTSSPRNNASRTFIDQENQETPERKSVNGTTQAGSTGRRVWAQAFGVSPGLALDDATICSTEDSQSQSQTSNHGSDSDDNNYSIDGKKENKKQVSELEAEPVTASVPFGASSNHMRSGGGGKHKANAICNVENVIDNEGKNDPYDSEETEDAGSESNDEESKNISATSTNASSLNTVIHHPVSGVDDLKIYTEINSSETEGLGLGNKVSGGEGVVKCESNRDIRMQTDASQSDSITNSSKKLDVSLNSKAKPILPAQTLAQDALLSFVTPVAPSQTYISTVSSHQPTHTRVLQQRASVSPPPPAHTTFRNDSSLHDDEKDEERMRALEAPDMPDPEYDDPVVDGEVPVTAEEEEGAGGDHDGYDVFQFGTQLNEYFVQPKRPKTLKGALQRLTGGGSVARRAESEINSRHDGAVISKPISVGGPRRVQINRPNPLVLRPKNKKRDRVDSNDNGGDNSSSSSRFLGRSEQAVVETIVHVADESIDENLNCNDLDLLRTKDDDGENNDDDGTGDVNVSNGGRQNYIDSVKRGKTRQNIDGMSSNLSNTTLTLDSTAHKMNNENNNNNNDKSNRNNNNIEVGSPATRRPSSTPTSRAHEHVLEQHTLVASKVVSTGVKSGRRHKRARKRDHSFSSSDSSSSPYVSVSTSKSRSISKSKSKSGSTRKSSHRSAPVDNSMNSKNVNTERKSIRKPEMSTGKHRMFTEEYQAPVRKYQWASSATLSRPHSSKSAKSSFKETVTETGKQANSQTRNKQIKRKTELGSSSGGRHADSRRDDVNSNSLSSARRDAMALKRTSGTKKNITYARSSASASVSVSKSSSGSSNIHAQGGEQNGDMRIATRVSNLSADPNDGGVVVETNDGQLGIDMKQSKKQSRHRPINNSSNNNNNNHKPHRSGLDSALISSSSSSMSSKYNNSDSNNERQEKKNKENELKKEKKRRGGPPSMIATSSAEKRAATQRVSEWIERNMHKGDAW